MMTMAEFVKRYEIMNPKSHYFSERTLKWFGEKLEDMRVLDDTVKLITKAGEVCECYVLERLQNGHPDGPIRTHAYFSVKTMQDIEPHPSLLGSLKTGLDFWPKDKPSVLNEIRKACATPKPPTEPKPKSGKTKKKNQPEH